MSQSREEESLDKEMEEENKEAVGGTKEEVTLDDEMEEKEKVDPSSAAADAAKDSRKRPKAEEESESAEKEEKKEDKAGDEDGGRLTRKKPKVDYSEAALAAAAAEVRSLVKNSISPSCPSYYVLVHLKEKF